METCIDAYIVVYIIRCSSAKSPFQTHAMSGGLAEVNTVNLQPLETSGWLPGEAIGVTILEGWGLLRRILIVSNIINTIGAASLFSSVVHGFSRVLLLQYGSGSDLEPCRIRGVGSNAGFYQQCKKGLQLGFNQ